MYVAEVFNTVKLHSRKLTTDSQRHINKNYVKFYKRHFREIHVSTVFSPTRSGIVPLLSLLQTSASHYTTQKTTVCKLLHKTQL